MRIVSMLSSATEIVYALGLEGDLVAISHECDYPPEAMHLPRASRSRFDPAGLDSGQIDAAVRRAMEEHGSVYAVDVEMLTELRPDLILTQAVCEVCAVPTGSVEEAVDQLHHRPRVLSLDTHTVPEILASVEEVAEAAGQTAHGKSVADGLRSRLDKVAHAVSGRTRPRTLLLEWLDPPFAPGHWVPEMVELAGGENLMGEAGERSREVAWEGLAGLDPDVLLVEPCGYDLRAARLDADRHAERLGEVAGRAVAERRAWLLHSSFYSRSGPRVIDGIETLASVLHPQAMAGAASRERAVQWP